LGAIIGSFGIKNGVETVRVCGTKNEIHELLVGAVKDGYKFHDTPNILHVHRGQWTVLLYMKIPVEVGKND
jgi:Mg2+/Co2+ transporter CorC